MKATLVFGDNTYQRDQEIAQLKKKYEQVEVLDGETVTLEQLQERLGASSLFASATLFIVRNLSNNKSAADKIEKIIESVSADNGLVLIEDAIDKRKHFYKTLKKQGDLIECKQLDERQASVFAQKYAKEKGGAITKQNADFLIQRVGIDQQVLRNELEKLLLNQSEIDQNAIEMLTEPRPEDSAFSLTDALVAHDMKRAISIYKDLRLNGQQPQEIIGIIGWQLEVLALLVAAKHEPSTATGLHPFVVRKNQVLAGKLTLEHIRRALNAATKADIRIKQTQNDPDQVMESLLLRLQAVLTS